MNLTSIGLSANRSLDHSSSLLSKTLEQAASGKAVNSAKDGPAAMVLSTLLDAQMSSSYQAVRNNQETSNVLSIAEGGLSSISSALQSARSLAIHSANSGVTSASQTSANQSELDSTLNSIQNIASSTTYGGRQLLSGSGNSDMRLQYGISSGDQTSISLPDVSLENIGKVTVDGQDYSLADLYSGGSASLASNPDIAQQVIDQAISDISGMRGEIGAYQSNTLESTTDSLNVAIENMADAANTVGGVDLAALSTELAQQKAMTELGLFAVQNVNQNQGQMLKLLNAL